MSAGAQQVCGGGRWRVRSGRAGRLGAWLRLVLFAGALCLAATGYVHHTAGRLAWWRWCAELAAGCALLAAALRQPPPPEGRTRRLLRVLAGVVVVAAVGIAAVFVPRPGYEVPAGAAVATAVVAFFLARWRPFRLADMRALIGDPDAESVWAEPAAFIPGRLLLGVASLTAAAYALYTNAQHHLAGFLFWMASLTLLALAAWRGGDAQAAAGRETWNVEAGPSLSPAARRMALLLILVLAAALRGLLLSHTPPWINPDEGRMGRWAQHMWDNGFPDVFGLGWNVFPHLSYLIDYLWIPILGVSNPALRLSAATVGTLSIAPTYCWVRRWWGDVPALLAAFFLAVNHEHIIWSRLGLNNMQQVLVAALMLAAFARVLRTRRAIDWVWLGFATGLAFHTYHAAKLYPLLLAVSSVLLAVGSRGAWRRYLPGAALAALACLLCIGPLAVTVYQRWHFFLASTANRVDLHVLGAAFARTDVSAVRGYLHTHVLDCLFAFVSFPSVRAAILDPFVAVPFLLGFGWMAWRWRDPRHLVLLVWVLGILVAGGMITDYPPAKARLLGFLPAVVAIPAVVAGRLRGLVHRVCPGCAEVLLVPIFGIWMLASLHYNWTTEFVLRPANESGRPMSEICRAINAAPLPATLYLAGGAVMEELRVAEHDCMIASRPDRVLVNLVDDPAIVPVPPANRGNAVLLLTRRQRELLPLVRHMYPDAREDIAHDARGTDVLHRFTLTVADIDRGRGLRATFRSAARTWSPARAADRFGPPQDAAFPLRASWFGLVWMQRQGVWGLRVPETARLRLDGRSLSGMTSLAAGWHTVEVRAEFARPAPPFAIEWRRPDASEWEAIPRAFLFAHGEGHGLLGRYFARVIDGKGPAPLPQRPDLARIETLLSFDRYTELDDTPIPPFAARTATMEWLGSVDIDSGPWRRLRLETTTPAEVYLDGRRVLVTSGALQGENVETALDDFSGRVPILVRTWRRAGPDWRFWKLRLLWAGPAGEWRAFVPYLPPEEIRLPGPEAGVHQPVEDRDEG